MPKTIKPTRLKKGDKVGIVSPSNSIRTRLDIFKKAVKNFEEFSGLKIVTSKHALERHFYTSASVEERVKDINEMFRNPDIKAIIFSVGGNTAIDLVDRLDYQLIKDNPKIFSGISDATTLLNSVNAKCGLTTFLGIEFLDFAREPMDYTKKQIKRSWFNGKIGEYKANPNWGDFDGNKTSYRGWRSIRKGKVNGRIIGGNFTSFFQLVNTPFFPDPKGNLLVMESYMWPKKSTHQALRMLRLHGIFDKISGLIIGYNVGSDNPEIEGNERDIGDVCLEVTEGYNFPIMQIGEIGHKVENLILPIGARATMDATNLKFFIDEPVVK